MDNVTRTYIYIYIYIYIYTINAAILNFLKESQRVYNCLIQLFKQNILILQLSLKGQVTLKADLFQKHNLTDPRIFKDIICTLICILAFLRGNLFWMAWSYALSVMFLWWPIQLDFEMGKWMHKPVRWLLHCTVILLYGLFISIFFFFVACLLAEQAWWLSGQKRQRGTSQPGPAGG